MRLAVTCLQLQRDFEAWGAPLRRAASEVVLPGVPGQQLAGDDLVRALAGVSGVIAGDDQFSRDVLLRLPKLKAISKWGVGIDGIDQEAAAELGIAVTNTPGVFAGEVADVALGYMIMLARDLHSIDLAVRNGGWPKPVGRSLAGAKLGLIGYGSIGRALARRALACGMAVFASDPFVPEHTADAGVEIVGLAEALSSADFVVLTCSLTGGTAGILNASTLSLLPRGARVINVARGGLIDQPALLDSLRDGHVAGAALDVMEVEPPSADSELMTLPVILGSHNASNTLEACERTHGAAIENLLTSLGIS